MVLAELRPGIYGTLIYFDDYDLLIFLLMIVKKRWRWGNNKIWIFLKNDLSGEKEHRIIER